MGTARSAPLPTLRPKCYLALVTLRHHFWVHRIHDRCSPTSAPEVCPAIAAGWVTRACASRVRWRGALVSSCGGTSSPEQRFLLEWPPWKDLLPTPQSASLQLRQRCRWLAIARAQDLSVCILRKAANSQQAHAASPDHALRVREGANSARARICRNVSSQLVKTARLVSQLPD